MFGFVFQISTMVLEKELKLRQVITRICESLGFLYSTFSWFPIWYTGNDCDGTFWFCLLVFVASMGGNYDIPFITPHSSFWNDVSASPFLEKQLFDCSTSVLSFPIEHGEFLLITEIPYMTSLATIAVYQDWKPFASWCARLVLLS